MIPNMTPDAWNLRSRIPRAVRAIQDLTEEAIADVLWARMSGKEDPALPKIERGEYPGDLFIDVVKRIPDEKRYLARVIKGAVARVLAREVKKIPLRDTKALAETIFVAARIESETAISPIFEITIHPDSKELVDGERLQSRALRALLGLLLAFRSDNSEKYEHVFESLMFEPDCMITCVTALIGLFGHERRALITRLQNSGLTISDNEIDLHLRICGLSA
jgi:hypothetical protein